VICLITYVVLRATIGPGRGASFIAYEIATGGDPFNFKELAAPHPILWVWILILHAVSWLMVPVLAATAVDAAYRRWEQRMDELDMEVQDEMTGILQRHVGIDGDQAEEIAQELWKKMSRKLAIKKRTR